MISSELAWDWLRRELDAWGERGIEADFWWRDDDAVEATPQLQQLLALGERHRLPIALAVIPGSLHETLPATLRDHPQIAVLQHGYVHQNHALPGQRSLELGGDYGAEQARSELEQGRLILLREFGTRFVNVMVPPWNRIDTDILHTLPELGFSGISAMRVRREANPVAGLLRVNTHLDPINWRHGRGFIGLYPALAILIQHLIARRRGYRDLAEPTGILSHHLVQNDATWRFLDELAGFLHRHPACRWRGAESIWPQPSLNETAR